MKSFREKLGRGLAWIYAVGIALSLGVGALSFLGYVAAIIIGGKTAGEICDFIYKDIYPTLFKVSSVSVMIGLVKMYVTGEKTMTPNKKK